MKTKLIFGLFYANLILATIFLFIGNIEYAIFTQVTALMVAYLHNSSIESGAK